jgi:hypothetical protein
MLEGELEGFLGADDRRNKKQRKRLLTTLAKFTATLDGDASTLQGMEANRETNKSTGLFVSRSTGHALLPWGTSITRFIDVLRPVQIQGLVTGWEVGT